MKICNNENKLKKYDLNYILSPNFIEDKNKIMKLIENRYDLKVLNNEKSKLLKKYIDKINIMTKKAIEYANKKQKK